jgi:hypothetical protein
MIYHPVSQIELAKLLSSPQSKNLQGVHDLHSQNVCLLLKFLHKVATLADTPRVRWVQQQYQPFATGFETCPHSHQLLEQFSQAMAALPSNHLSGRRRRHHLLLV